MLEWDSAFFLRNIVAVYFTNNETPNLAELENQLTVLKAHVAYCFVPEDCITLQGRLEANGATLVDRKMTFSKRFVQEGYKDFDGVYSYKGELNAELISLSIEAGKYSRFKLDAQLCEHFEKLYTEWLSKSLKRENADEVFVYSEEDKIKGIITCKKEQGIGIIGLIATEQGLRGKGVGRKLVNAAENYFIGNGIMISKVITQHANHVACQFYESLGYRKLQVEDVYHWWLKQANDPLQ